MVARPQEIYYFGICTFPCAGAASRRHGCLRLTGQRGSGIKNSACNDAAILTQRSATSDTEAIPLSEKAIRLNPRSGYLYNRYRDMGFGSLMLGREPRRDYLP
jgi:hypothetical protein